MRWRKAISLTGRYLNLQTVKKMSKLKNNLKIQKWKMDFKQKSKCHVILKPS